MIEPFFFGPRDAFALFHPAINGDSGKLVIICPPLFDEHRRCYKALAELGSACATAGVNVLRVDYSGIGEAGGQLSEFTVRDWIDDVKLAVEEGIALTGARQVVLVGVRFGSLLAGQCKSPQISRYVFWDPIIKGHQYLDYLERVDNDSAKQHKKLLRICSIKQISKHYKCFELSSDQRDSISDLTIEDLLSEDDIATSIVTTDKEKRQQYGSADYEYADFTYDWPIKHKGLLTPKPVLRCLMEKITK
jgi:alpha-beta hydrolase superfamily lysophospholipase